MMPSSRSVRSCLIFGAAIAYLGASAQTQPPISTATGKISLKTTLGSFKLVSHSDEDPVNGKLEINFTGTVLVSGLDPKGYVTISGAVHKEYGSDKYRKMAYFGKGKITIEGKARSIQWFGHDLSGTFQGRGIFRLYGEFDHSNQTGSFWYGDPSDTRAKRKPWGTYGTYAVVPDTHTEPATDTVPTPRKGGG